MCLLIKGCYRWRLIILHNMRTLSHTGDSYLFLYEFFILFQMFRLLC